MTKKIISATIFTSILLNAFSPLSYINTLRQKSGASSLKYDSHLSIAAKKHAIYVNKNNEYSHYEVSTSSNYFASTPWSRIVKAGFGTKVVIENISFLNSSYKSSIDQLMATVYHRLAFLYLQIDSIGYANSGKMYVYDMSNSKIAKICAKHIKNAPMIIDSVCPNQSDIVPQSKFNSAINSILKKSKKIIIYPYKNQKNVPLKGTEEAPKFLYRKFGYPITVTFNQYYFKSVKLISLKLYSNGSEINAKLVSKSNDINGKIRDGTFVLVPYKYLRPHTTYKVVLKYVVSGKNKTLSWNFTTK